MGASTLSTVCKSKTLILLQTSLSALMLHRPGEDSMVEKPH